MRRKKISTQVTRYTMKKIIDIIFERRKYPDIVADESISDTCFGKYFQIID